MGSFSGLGNRVQFTAATFRPARTTNVGQYMEGFPSYQQHQTISNVANGNLIDIVGRTVVLQNKLMEDAGEGIVVAHRTRELLS